MTVVEDLRKKIAKSCLVSAIRKDGIRIDLSDENAERIMIIDFDKNGSPLGKNDTRPDLLFVADTGGIAGGMSLDDPGRLVPIEASLGKSKKPEDVRSQLQAGANCVNEVLDEKLKPTLLPVFLGKPGKHVRNEIEKTRYNINFRGQQKGIRIMRNGRKLPTPE